MLRSIVARSAASWSSGDMRLIRGNGFSVARARTVFRVRARSVAGTAAKVPVGVGEDGDPQRVAGDRLEAEADGGLGVAQEVDHGGEIEEAFAEGRVGILEAVCTFAHGLVLDVHG